MSTGKEAMKVLKNPKTLDLTSGGWAAIAGNADIEALPTCCGTPVSPRSGGWCPRRSARSYFQSQHLYLGLLYPKEQRNLLNGAGGDVQYGWQRCCAPSLPRRCSC